MANTDAESLTKTGGEHRDRFERTGDRSDLDIAIAAFREAVSMLSHDSAQRAKNLYDLLCTLHIRYDEFGDVRDLSDAINAGNEAVESNAAHAGYLSALGALLYARYLTSKDPSDLEQTIDLCRRATVLPPTEDSDVKSSLSNLAVALLARYRLHGSVDDLEQSIDLERTALALTRPGPSRKASLINLAFGLCELFELRDQPEALEEAVVFGRRAVNARPRDGRTQAQSLNMLAHVLEVRSAHGGSPQDLDEAIARGREAFELTPSDRVDREDHLAGLVTMLSARSRLTGSPEDIDEAVDLVRAHVADQRSAPEGSKSAASLLMYTLDRRYAWDGAVSYLDEAIATGRAGVDLTAGHTRRGANDIRTLSDLLWVRFRQFGSIPDIDAAIQNYRTLLASDSGDPGRRATDASSLSIFLWARHKRTEDRHDLDEAIGLSRQAVADTGHAEDRAMHLANLGAVLAARFDSDGSVSDLDESVTATRSALAAEVRSRTDRARFHANLASALVERFDRTGEAGDLDQAVADGAASAELIGDRSPERARFLSNLGGALERRFEVAGLEEDRDAAIARYEAAWASDASPVHPRIVAARRAAKLILPSDPGRASDLMVAAVQLLPQLSPRRLARGEQQRELRGSGELVAEAASLVLADDRVSEPERASRALNLLEIGRAVLIGQALEGRGDLSELRVRHPELAARLIELRDFLDAPSEPGSPPSTARTEPGALSRPASAKPEAGRDRHELGNEFNALLDRVRALAGFETFGLPPSSDELLEVAQVGPVAVLIVSRYGAHALLITRTGVTAEPLAGLDPDGLAEKVDAFLSARRSILRGTDLAESYRAGADVVSVLEWLWDTVAGPVLDALGLVGEVPADSSAGPRIWWVPCGALNLLPIHAAGHHAPNGEQPRQTVIDRAVSSYTPSVRMLIHACRRAGDLVPGPAPRALAVAMPTTPGMADQGRLPSVLQEVQAFCRHFPQATVLEGDATGADGPPAAVRDQVLARLPGHEIVHFACHAVDDPRDPSRSRVLLADHERNPLTVASLTPLALERAQIAFLSACNTGSARSVGLVDESIHLASAFQVAGFDHVVGTLWETDDRLSVTVADSFYTYLRVGSGHIDARLAARALHRAVREARDGKDRPGAVRGPRNPFLWAAYIHVGA